MVVEQERSEREGREEMHKNELRLVEELLNGRQAFVVCHATYDIALCESPPVARMTWMA